MSRSAAATASQVLLWDLPPAAVEAFLVGEMGEVRYRARQILRGVYRGGRRDLAALTDLPRSLRDALAVRLSLALPAVRRLRQSTDGSRKMLLRLADGREVEAVHLVEGARVTFCVSSQVGCAFGCRFCLTARMGLLRQLSAGEIVGQVLVMADAAGMVREGFNVVFMGMGEPLHNFPAVAAALEILMSPACLGISYRRITLSTVGEPEGIHRLAGLRYRPRLAVSLNASDDHTRSQLMPVNRAHPIARVMQALADYPLRPGERVTLEYVLLAGVNDGPEDAARLAALARGLPCKINLIPLNDAPELPFRRPDAAAAEAFRDRLLSRGIPATLRWSRGLDIRAACGQLVLEDSA